MKTDDKILSIRLLVYNLFHLHTLLPGFLPLGQYPICLPAIFRKELISARSNEANLGQEEFAWLLFGIHDKTHAVLGSSYKPTRPSLDALKREIAEGTNCGITFTEIHEIMYQGKRVIMFQIPAVPKGIPTSYKGYYYGRDGESLSKAY